MGQANVVGPTSIEDSFFYLVKIIPELSSPTTLWSLPMTYALNLQSQCGLWPWPIHTQKFKVKGKVSSKDRVEKRMVRTTDRWTLPIALPFVTTKSITIKVSAKHTERLYTGGSGCESGFCSASKILDFFGILLWPRDCKQKTPVLVAVTADF